MKALLDTHVLLWWMEGGHRLGRAQATIIAEASDDSPLWVSEITLWEIAMLADLGRVSLRLPLRDWLEHATAPPLVRRLSITPAIAAETAQLPNSFHRDPADRIIIATAMVHNATLLTSDRRIIESDLVRTI